MKQVTARSQQQPEPTDGSDGVSSSDLLLFAAERLYAEKGIDGVSMREISREAAQKNTSALHYHFGSKEALIRAILQRRMREFDDLRNAFLDDALSRGESCGLRTAVEALVKPMATSLLASGKVNYYNRFLAAAQIHPDIDIFALASGESDRGFHRVYVLLRGILTELPPRILTQRYLSSLDFIMFSLADFEAVKARRERRNRSFDIERAIENLIDMVTGALLAPVSDQVMSRLTNGSDR
jgi:AcrR family transcriptional regulator